MSKGCGCCADRRNDRKDFRQDHGGGPEELPHRKKGRGKKYCNKNKGPHVFDTVSEWRTYGKYRYRYPICKCGKHYWGRAQAQYLKDVAYTVDGERVIRQVWI